MKAEDLEQLLEGGTETPSLDYKASCPWDVGKFVKDFLAMANVQEGGTIIIGVEEQTDGTYLRTGVNTTDRQTYNRDNMMDKVTQYADPHVSFKVDFLKDKADLEYVVITIEAFREIPVLCKKDGVGLKVGGMYYRNRNRRVESALVSNSYDMRDIIERAAVKLSQRARQIGYSVANSDKELLDMELDDL